MSAYCPNREERAFLYQEAQNLEPLLKGLGSLSVVVEEVKPERPRYRVTFLLAPESLGMRVQATDKNLFDATIAAKEEAVRQLSAVINSMPGPRPNHETNPPVSGQLLH